MNAAVPVRPLSVGTAAILLVAPIMLIDAPTIAIEQAPSAWFSIHPLQGGFPALAAETSLVSLVASTNAVIESTANQVVTAERTGVLMERVARLRELSDGWVGEGSIAPNSEVLGWLGDHASLIASSGQSVSMIPIEDGSVALRWTHGAEDFTAEVRAGARLYLFVDNTAADDFQELETALTPERLAGFLRHGLVS